jgi:hypothetical protein
MEYLSVTLNVLTIILILIVGWLVKSYFPAYFSEKGKNLATKEDIGRITSIVESTRTQYLAALERLKTEFSVSSEYQSRLKEKEREALLSLFDDCVILLADKLSYNFGDLTYEESKQLMQYHKSVDRLFTQIFIGYNRLHLYLPGDSKLLIAAEELTGSVFEIRKVFRKHFGKLRLAISEESEAMAAGNRQALDNLVPETDAATKAYYSHLRPAEEKLRLSFKGYIDALNRHFKDEGINKLATVFLEQLKVDDSLTG